MHTPNRRQVIGAALAAGGVACVAATFGDAGDAPPGRPGLAALLPQVRAAYDALLGRCRAWAANDPPTALARADGYAYTVELAQLMLAFAGAGDRDAYAALRDFAVPRLVRDDPADPYTRGFVPWRHKPGQAADASGTTEALRLAKALWTGSRAFDRPADAETALLILSGYARHAAVEQGVWLVRNYFNFGTRAFATNSFLVDYDPDFVAAVARDQPKARGEDLKDLADKSYALLKRAVAPSGLLYDLVQPEVKTLVPGLDVTVFSPNDVIQISNSCTVAATAAAGLPEVARGVLDFMTRRGGQLRMYYYGRNGEAVKDDQWPGVCEYGGIARLAALLGERGAAAGFAARALPAWTALAKDDPPAAYAASESLLAMEAVLRL